MLTCSECGEEIPDAVQSDPLDMTMNRFSGVARQCSCGWTCCFRCDPIYDRSETGHECPQCKTFRQGNNYYDPATAQVTRNGWTLLDGDPKRWSTEQHDQWKKDRQSERWINIRRDLATRLGLESTFMSQAKKATTWEQLAAAFTSTEALQDKPNFAALLEVASSYGASSQQGIWITVAEKFRSLNKSSLACYAYSEALVALPTSSTVAWMWLYQLIKEIGTASSEELVERMTALGLVGPRPGLPDDSRTIPSLASKIRAFARQHIEDVPRKDVDAKKSAALEKQKKSAEPKRVFTPRSGPRIRTERASNFVRWLGMIAGVYFGAVFLGTSLVSFFSLNETVPGMTLLVSGLLNVVGVPLFRKRANIVGGILVIISLVIVALTFIYF